MNIPSTICRSPLIAMKHVDFIQQTVSHDQRVTHFDLFWYIQMCSFDNQALNREKLKRVELPKTPS
jgi:hypothetical protein